MIPFYLKDHLADVHEKKHDTKAILVSTAANSDLEIFYYGDISFDRKKNPLIIEGDCLVLIVARDPLSGEEFVVFDGSIHGYDAMFCSDPLWDRERHLVRFSDYQDKIQIKLGYSIDYDNEKGIYDFDENGDVVLQYGNMQWDKAKSIGFDWISLTFMSQKYVFLRWNLPSQLPVYLADKQTDKVGT